MTISSEKIPVNIWQRMDLAQRWDILCRETVEIHDEGDLHRELLNLLGSLGIVHQHDRMDKKTRGTKGWPDFTICLPHGRTWYLEIKHPSLPNPMTALSEDQDYVRRYMIKMGHDYSLLQDWSDIKEELRRRLF